MKAYKGFNQKLQCRPSLMKPPFQYEVGQTYIEDRAELCWSGFHACEHPCEWWRWIQKRAKEIWTSDQEKNRG